jgi:hypothetical protein
MAGRSHDETDLPSRATPTTGGTLPKKIVLQISSRSTGPPYCQPAMTGVAEPLLFHRFMERPLKGMDITEYVKRNNFAVAQYELKSRCTAQNRLLSKDTSWSRLALPSANRSRAVLRIAARSPNCESLQSRVAAMGLSAELTESPERVPRAAPRARPDRQAGK